jgi:serine/threonine protein kinase
VKKLYPPLVKDLKSFANEATLHRRLRHPNVVQLMGICLTPPCVVLEFMARGTLYGILQNTTVELSLKLRLSFLRDVARGMTFLHAQGLIHRDLKSLNVLVDDDWRAKIADFGSTKGLGSLMSSISGTVLWCAPEVLTRGLRAGGFGG